ncbi:MAG: DUF2384 domain-containing protein [Ignavibacteria bacterium]|jgi:putative toxin-antitoxin system antitoxin component (TIGR02293 family)|nr:DUF2384 domain-containing protein [Ignavibacteria bacterium]MBK6878164.1 DUF2384 domain-containing protein [Ignavibacteria bacterium]
MSALMEIEKKLDKEVISFLKELETGTSNAKGKKSLNFEGLLSDTMLKIFAIRQGIPFHLFYLITLYSPYSENDWISFLDISKKSLQRYKQESRRFGHLQSEKIIEMAEVTKVGLEVFGDMDKFKLWLSTPNFALGSMKPIELIRDSYGKDLVVGELTRINYGIFA